MFPWKRDFELNLKINCYCYHLLDILLKMMEKIIKGDEPVTATTQISVNDRRKNTDRRHFTYTFYIPERRNGDDRRRGADRRDGRRYSNEAVTQVT